MPAAERSSHTQSTGHASSHASVRFGCLAVERLAAIVNWNNEPGFTAGDLNPWSGLELEISKASQASHSPHQDSAPSSIKQPESEPESVQSSDSMAGIEPRHTGSRDVEASPAIANQVSTSDVSYEQATVSEDAIEEAQLTGEEASVVADVDTSTIMSNEEMVSPANTQAPAEKTSSNLASASIALPIPREPERAAPTAQAAVNEKSARQPEQTSPRAKRVTAVSTPTPTMAPITMPMSSTKSVERDSDYLHRLESLVLELNLQLARASGDDAIGTEDYTQWLSQRVIDLSLENQRLRQQLAQQTVKSSQ